MSRTYRRRLFAVTAAVIMAFGLLTGAVLLRMRAAPEPARLLPECNGVLYINVKPIRQFTSLGKKQVGHAPEYLKFVQETGFDVERDLDEVAFAMHIPQDAQHETRYSEVVVGRFNSSKLADFFARNARSQESYQDHDVVLIPFEDRIVRVSVLSADTVAISNTGDPAQIDHIIDEFRRSAFATSGPRLLARYYHNVPFGSLAWLITDVSPPKTMSLADTLGPISLMRQLFSGGVVVGSARYNGKLLLRADNFLPDDPAAKDRAEQFQNLLSLYKTSESQTRPEHPDPDMESALNSLDVEQKGNRVQVNASIPSGLIQKMFEAPEEPAPIPQPAPQAKPKRHRRR